MTSQRRMFLRSVAAVSAASYGRILGANDRVRIAAIGTGGRCRYLLGLATAQKAQLVAVAEIYEPNAQMVREKLAPEAQIYTDYRHVLDRKDYDATFIGSPDHWHVPMTMDAVRAGKDVYVEKPVSHSIEEGQALLRLMAGSSQVVQVGYQQRSWDHFREARDLVAAGKLGKVTLVLASWYQAFYRATFPVELGGSGEAPEVQADKLDWKKFLGSAPEQPFDPYRFRYWRWYWDFGGGHLTDLYSHYGDVIHWYLGMDTPRAVQSVGARSLIPRFECPDTITAAYTYPGDVSITYTGTLSGALDGGNIIFRGTQALMKINRDGFAIYPEGVVPNEKTNYPDAVIQARSMKDGTIDHVANFLECVRSRKKPNSPPETAVPIAHAAHLGNIAYRSGNTATWPVTG